MRILFTVVTIFFITASTYAQSISTDSNLANPIFKEVSISKANPSIVKSIKASGKTPVCMIEASYISSVAKNKKLPPAEAIGQEIKNKPGSNWLDMSRMDLIKPWLEDRIKACKSLGFEYISFKGLNASRNKNGEALDEKSLQSYKNWLKNKSEEYNLLPTEKPLPKPSEDENDNTSDKNISDDKTKEEQTNPTQSDYVTPGTQPSTEIVSGTSSQQGSGSSSQGKSRSPSSAGTPGYQLDKFTGNSGASNSNAGPSGGGASTWPNGREEPVPASGKWNSNNSSFDWQLTDPKDLNVPVAVMDLDLFETDAQTVTQLRSRGVTNICYVSSGTDEDWRPSSMRFPSSVLGGSYPEWPGERWVNIKKFNEVTAVMSKRIQMCKQKGFDIIEFDNIDPYSNKTGLNITEEDQIKYSIWLANEAHKNGLLALQKNAPELVKDLSRYYDGALLESCSDDGNKFCADFAPYVSAKKPVFAVTYDMSDGNMAKFCAHVKSLGIVGVGKTKALNKTAKFCPK